MATINGSKNSMAVFGWSDKYSVKNQEIDTQHKKLIGLIAELDASMRQGKGKQALEKVLRELVQYTVTHFSTEERLMHACGYPELEAHKEKHRKMTQKVLEIQNQYQEGRITLTLEVMKFLENWIDKHILGTDMQYAPWLQNRS